MNASVGGNVSAAAGAEEIYDDGPLYAAAKKVYPQKVGGAYRRIKWAVLWGALGVYYILPFVRWDRGPNKPAQAVLIDMEHSRFYAFFIELWPQEVYYFTGLLILAALALFLSNALFGRVWCGYACPQTVWTDLYLWVERAIEGDRRDRIRLDAAPWTPDKIMKRLAKHAAWVVIAMLTGGAFVLYFMDAPTLCVQFAAFKAPLVAYLWAGILTLTTYALAGHMREQVCLYMCPWPRIQAALIDPDALNVTYRTDRGEPRMSVKEAARARVRQQPAGDCIDCFQCVHVCPTGVDIRKGWQLGCINCGLCIDACDAVMTKVHRPTRLIAYDTDDNIGRRMRAEPAVYRPVRPRTILYAAAIALTGSIMLYALITRTSMHLSVLHVRAPLFTVTAEGGVRNGYTLRFSNKLSEPSDFALAVSGLKGATMTSVVAKPLPEGRLSVRVDADATFEAPVYVTTPPDANLGKSTPVTFTATEVKTGERNAVVDNFFGP
ncbi:MAG: cytochrome c oxidase accessory protein CcoG [Hyphomicrobiales bacterium]|nr:cytochrome c oxidase accessory protein CcoG [Hyphomicrobiales bacterium]